MRSLTARFKRFTSGAIAALLLSISAFAPPALVAVTSTLPAVSAVAPAAVAAIALSAVSTPAQATDLTDYLENKLIDWLFRAQSYTPPSSLYISLHTAACSDSSTGTEVSGGSYARVAVVSGTSTWANTQASGTGASSGTNGTTSNGSAITFPSPTANWGSVTHFAIFDASTSGNMLICKALTTAKTVNNGDAAPSFAAGALTFQIDN